MLHLVVTAPSPGPNMLRWLDSALTGRPGPHAGGHCRTRPAAGRAGRLHPYPSLLKVPRAGGAPWSGDRFEFGSRRLLDGIEALVASRRD
ncbi:hypothetical protein [Actinosynnema sp. NPDC023587]|uniref:hypothetical protein n=1 Tax=Actinosynnema sp. NPDC023587 TaxID=3154695 RepID=UPI0033DA0685